MAGIWGPENRFKIWLDVEVLAAEAWYKLGKIPEESMNNIKQKAAFDIRRIDEIEREVKHDVIAFLTCVSESVGEDARYIHMGMTSSDVLDTTLALQLTQAADIILEDVKALREILKQRSFEHKDTLMIGRSHGIHAEPITFGLKMALYFEEFGRNLDRIERAREAVRVGKISGAVGTYAHLDPYVEEYVCDHLGLIPSRLSTQIIQRDRQAEFFSSLAILASSIEKLAVEIRHLQRTEVLEVEEPFTSGQKGSSAMPHKKNPILSENLSGLARLVRSYSMASLENIPLWHERDISHSSVERVIGPDATILIDYMCHRLKGILKGMVVHPENMKANLNRLKGLIHSQAVLLALTEGGCSREEAYGIVQDNAMKVWNENKDFLELLKEDDRVRGYINEESIKDIFDLSRYTRHIDGIYKRVFGES